MVSMTPFDEEQTEFSGHDAFAERPILRWVDQFLHWLDDYVEERPIPPTDMVLWSVVVVGSVFDILTTMVGLGVGLREGNLVARAFVETYGVTGIGWLKLGALVGLVVSWFVLPKRPARILLFWFAIVSLVAVAFNVLTLMGV
ncbi:MAG: DUF5658 family protein [Halodesulfurarchaeum sp.]